MEDTCRLEEELEDNVQQQVMPAMNIGQAGCSTRRRDTARGRGRGTGRVEFMGHPVDTEYATRSVSEDKVSSAWRLFIDDSILRHIKRCTEGEAARAGEQNWSLAIEELDAFIALYTHGGRMAAGQLTMMCCGM